MNGMSTAEKLAANKFNLDEGNPHIIIDQELCRSLCREYTCLSVCPAKLYSRQGDEILVEWAGCLECGTCQVACPHAALSWQYPSGGLGVFYRYG
jgi:ferredoxin like protein